MVVGQGMLWDRDTVALRMQEACGCHGAGSAVGRGHSGMWDAVGQSCCEVLSYMPELISCGCVLARAGNGFEARWYLLRVLTAPQGQFH